MKYMSMLFKIYRNFQTHSNTRRTTPSKFIFAILFFLCLGHTKTKENQTDSEPQWFICEPQHFK